MATIQVKLKRHVLHKTDYMFETVRPSKVLDALKYLITTPLYQKHQIDIDKKFLSIVQETKGKFIDNVDFVVDEKDKLNDYTEDVPTNPVKVVDNDESYQWQSEIELEGLTQLETDFFENGREEYCYEKNDEVLLIDRNLESTRKVQVIAPGQDKQPLPWLLMDDLEELCFPKIFAGQKCDGRHAVSYTDRVKSEVRRKDRRSCIPTRLLFMAKKKLELSCYQNINVCLRKSKRTESILAQQVLDKTLLDNIFRFDEGYKMLRQIRSSPAYWETRKRELMATIRQLGKPTFFLTLTAAESWWPELMQMLVQLSEGKKISLQEAFLLDDNKKTELVRNDPVTCARYFDHKANKFMNFVKQDNSVFGEHTVVDSYVRVEFQQRGSPHEHIFLWLDKCPQYNPESANSIQECETFIDKFISCELDERDPYIALQRHKHTHTCYKKSKTMGGKKCRFHFPIPVMNKTTILCPLPKEYRTKDLKGALEKINNLMEDFFKNPKLVPFENVLEELQIDEVTYKRALRTTLERPHVFLKRTSLEVGINSYNKDILHLFEANIDLQFVVEEYGIASYIINYVSKADKGLSKLLRLAAADADNGNLSVKEKFRKITNVFLNSNIMSAQEAAYHCLSLPLSKSSRICYYINTSPTNERVQMLKSKKELALLEKDSIDVFVDNVITRYTKRGKTLENVCLADFVANIKTKKASNNERDEEGNSDLEDESENRNRQKPAVIRYRRYKFDQDPINYYREQAMLFLPWRDEEKELENVDIQKIYLDNRNIIEDNRKKYSVLEDETLEQCIKKVENENDDTETVSVNRKVSVEEQVDILQQGGMEAASNNNKTNYNRFTCPQRISEDDMYGLLRNLNSEQRQFIMHVLNCFKTGKTPFRVFLSGSAGVGKSTVINSVYQLITHYFDNIPGDDKGEMYVLLCAPSGKAAFLIGGVTLHTAFALPIAQFGGNMPELSSDVANTIREKLFHLKLLIIDEISMVGSNLFNRVDTRLRQIFGVNESFGGVSVMVVGDFNQLPPVLDSPVYKMSRKNEMFAFFDVNPLWEEFCYYELTTIMRQKEEIAFVEALNNLAMGNLNDDNIKLFHSREVEESSVPDDAIRLYFDNASVDKYNKKKIESAERELFISIAEDCILGQVSAGTKKKVFQSLKHKKPSDTGGLPYKLHLKVGIKYMITANIDVEDGLVNGACGTLKMITFKPNTKEPHRLWIDFALTRVGTKAKLAYKELIKNENINETWTPVEKSSLTLSISNKLQHQTVRKQFPMVPAEALTIHKSQGQTYSSVCFDFRKVTRITRALLYVAFSRVTNLSGLFILGTFHPPKQSTEDNSLSKELKRLKLEKRLELSFDSLEDDKCIKIIYQNLGTLKSKITDINSDDWYARGEIVIFSETLTKENDIIAFESYKVLFRSDITGKSRGLLCLVKRHSKIIVNNVQHSLYTIDSGSLEFVWFVINDKYNVVTGYKSPKISNEMFSEKLGNILTPNVLNNLILIGDFNCNVFKDHSNESFFNVVMKDRFNLQSLLPVEAVTTNLGTQIDVVYSNIPFVQAGVYETYFSYHKPIFAKMYNRFEDINDNSHRAMNTRQVNTSNTRTYVAKNNIKKNDECYYVDSQERDSGTVKDHCRKINPEENRNNHINIILRSTEYLDDEHIEMFHNLLRESSRNEFQPQYVGFYQFPDNIVPIAPDHNHIQILFMDKGVDKIGHWICTYYSKDTEEISIYDSSSAPKPYKLDLSAEIYLERLYPNNRGYKLCHVQQQQNGYDCGVFAIAFATTLYLRQNPEVKRYEICQMRKHLVEMLRNQEIVAFPEQKVK